MRQATIKDLSPERRAVLSLLITQRCTYEQIAAKLNVDARSVRARAHAAADQLARSDELSPSPVTRALIADYLLGQQTHAERVRACYGLAASEVERDWAMRLARSLAPLSKVPLPVIPGAGLPQTAGGPEPARSEPGPRPAHRRAPARR